MKIALDTNVLAYAEGINDDGRQALARDLIDRLAPAQVVIPVQVLGELFHVLVRKARRSPADARQAVLDWHRPFSVIETSSAALLAAADLTVDHRFDLWDAVILSVSAEAGCRLLLSEDMQDGFTWRGLTVVNPFVSPQHPLLASLVTPPRAL